MILFKTDGSGRALASSRLGRFAALTALAVCMTLGAGNADAKKISNMKIGNWKGGAYTNNSTGEFSHCAASAKYKSGLLLLFSVTRTRKWSMGFSKPSWNLQRGRRFPIRYQVDDNRIINGEGIAKSAKLVQVFLPTSDRLFQIFQNGDLLKVKTAKTVLKFRLTDTNPMLKRLLRCAINYTSGGGNDPFSNNNSNDDPFSPSGSSDPFSD